MTTSIPASAGANVGTGASDTALSRSRTPAASMALASMTCVQLGAAISTHLFGTLGTSGTAWLRLAWAAVVYLIIGRPRVWRMAGRDLAAAAALGVTSATMTLAFFEAIDRLPLATAVAVEFLGPLAVGLAQPRGRRWPPLAFVGVLLVTEPWHGSVSLTGLGFAAGAGTGWAVYILLTQRVADSFRGLDGLSLSMPVAAVVSGIVGLPQAWPHLTAAVLLEGLGLALLLPILPYALELLALRQLTTAAFGTLMSLEPAIALVIGLTVLHQHAALVQVFGVLVVTAASAGAAGRPAGRRHGG